MNAIISFITEFLPAIVIVSILLFTTRMLRRDYTNYLENHSRVIEKQTGTLSRIADALENRNQNKSSQ